MGTKIIHELGKAPIQTEETAEETAEFNLVQGLIGEWTILHNRSIENIDTNGDKIIPIGNK